MKDRCLEDWERFGNHTMYAQKTKVKFFKSLVKQLKPAVVYGCERWKNCLSICEQLNRINQTSDLSQQRSSVRSL